MKKILYLLEFLLLYFIFFILKLLPINFVSYLGGKFFQMISPLSNSHKTAIKNYKKVYLKLSNKQIKIDILKSWNNLGKTLFELSILNKLLKQANKRIEFFGIKNLNEIKKNNEQVIFFGIHQANWELLVPSLNRLGIKVVAIYRHINNPFINKMIVNIRNNSLINNECLYTPKGKESAKAILSAIEKGRSIILLIDQKDTAGNQIDFFGYKVKTQTGFLKIAKKNNLKLIPVQCIREHNNNFKIIFHSSIKLLKENDENKDMLEIHKIVENWINENPQQWLWQHKRFS